MLRKPGEPVITGCGNNELVEVGNDFLVLLLKGEAYLSNPLPSSYIIREGQQTIETVADTGIGE